MDSNKEQFYSAKQSNSRKQGLLTAGAVVCIVAAVVEFILIYGSNGPASDQAHLGEAVGRSTTSSTSIGRALVAPFITLAVGLVLILLARATTQELRLEGTTLRQLVGKKGKLLAMVDLAQLAEARAISNPYHTNQLTGIKLKDSSGNIMDLDLNFAGFKAGDVPWLREPLQTALQKIGADQNAQIQPILSRWFGNA
jgi:hypothetical protein